MLYALGKHVFDKDEFDKACAIVEAALRETRTPTLRVHPTSVEGGRLVVDSPMDSIERASLAEVLWRMMKEAKA